MTGHSAGYEALVLMLLHGTCLTLCVRGPWTGGASCGVGVVGGPGSPVGLPAPSWVRG